MRTRIFIYRSDDKEHMERMIANSKLPLPFFLPDRKTKVGEVVEMFVEEDKIVGVVEHDQPLDLPPEQRL